MKGYLTKDVINQDGLKHDNKWATRYVQISKDIHENEFRNNHANTLIDFSYYCYSE
jgi:hypothetical protein